MNYNELRNDRDASLSASRELKEFFDGKKQFELQRLLKINQDYAKLQEMENKEIMEDFDKLLARIKAYRRHKDADSIVDEMVDEHAKSLGWVCGDEQSKDEKVSLEDIFKGIVETLEKEIDSCQDKKEEVKEELKAYILVDQRDRICGVTLDKEFADRMINMYSALKPNFKFKRHEISNEEFYGSLPDLVDAYVGLSK